MGKIFFVICSDKIIDTSHIIEHTLHLKNVYFNSEYNFSI